MSRHDVLTLIPGTALGSYTLGVTLWHVLETLRARGDERAVSVRWDREDPKSPVIVDAPEGVSLVFPQTGPPYHQLLHLMVLQLGPDDREKNSSRRATEVVYDGGTLIGSDVPSRLTRGTITQRFGPSFARREQRSSSAASRMTAHEGQVTYPGVIFSTKAEEEDVVRSIAVVARGKEEELFVRTYMERLSGGKGPWEVWKSPEKGVEGSIAYCEIHPGKGITLHFSAGANHAESPYDVVLGNTTSQDLLADLGPPARRYWKDDPRFTADEASASGSQGCWWNYFELGLDFLVGEASEGTVSKIMVHSNIPGTAAFQRHARCPWTIRTTEGTRELTLGSTIQDFADAFPLGDARRSSVRGGTAEGRTVRIDRLDEPQMAGIKGIEPSQLLDVENMVVEGGSTGITSVLLF
ncbi:hypothetical protein NliqN6_2949 [Naganishia liquefaciens]|uniref:Uncharacterized protein n=1 Tax=Naganishia liquefaciens TaxID=104408 RepID=A0A8H3YFT9_9TREE|nr:hypothetical protein NliqN6_2949 [Naganishia liquefaciens]